jgi:hypothetical protein
MHCSTDILNGHMLKSMQHSADAHNDHAWSAVQVTSMIMICRLEGDLADRNLQTCLECSGGALADQDPQTLLGVQCRCPQCPRSAGLRVTLLIKIYRHAWSAAQVVLLIKIRRPSLECSACSTKVRLEFHWPDAAEYNSLVCSTNPLEWIGPVFFTKAVAPSPPEC